MYRGVRLIFLIINLFFHLKIFVTFTNSVESDEMPHHAAFHLGLHCLCKVPFKGFPIYKGLEMVTFQILMTFVSVIQETRNSS